MNQSQAIDYMWQQGYFEEYRPSKEIAEKIWELFKITCSNVVMILKNKKYLISDKKGWRQRYGSENKKSSDSGGIHVVYFEASKPVTASKKVEDIFENLNGEILICDNYFGPKSMLNLYKFSKASKIKFICGNVVGDIKTMVNLVQDYNKEKDLEVKVFDKIDLHDRYAITPNYLIILGHGLADLGNKESLVIVLPRNLVEDICLDLKNRFIQKWNGSKDLKY